MLREDEDIAYRVAAVVRLTDGKWAFGRRGADVSSIEQKTVCVDLVCGPLLGIGAHDGSSKTTCRICPWIKGER
jgi:hypothetical protein